ncbi:MAG: cell division ATP-binding protein FtsE [Candidatus Levybacteria bacterium CG_4_10_14_0_2_um_filter_36_16]|nr:MAG: cell division ATP-binding protein FtsE [Candidatus Levybacteria bacterium CG2_30_37_29]PIR78869.1 MAG: cell division ATP-binding protein FtsE [Candidatus Levybacteria bacterium CG10_big_fil_rev_8_21_14_0_10_36_30]PIZ96533.1 MAG: cell division ATP-binding protein FtsE [Candidatus Levybacteria bacterium CG_4_10_14_0_2_um_filter_36_16]PJA90577.1 MAG: cell division ATP-binding protein FtsE [Candidatus Levybacteria bacterium CG_4_9_14_3_um_filter_36_7]
MIIFKDVSKKYGADTVLDKINFSIDKGSFVFLMGPTTSGKTTIFRLIIRDLIPNTGEISLGEMDLVKLPKNKIPTLRRKVGVVFQDLKLLMDRTVLENVMLPLELSGVKADDAKKKAEEILIEVGLNDKFNKFPLQVSGGEKQRVAIARALVFNPDVILADEPTGNLDSQTSFQIVDLLESINKKGATVFMATHNEKIIEKSNSRVIILEKGKIISDKNPKKSFSLNTKEKGDSLPITSAQSKKHAS